MIRSLSKRIPIKGRGYSVAYQSCGPLTCNMYTLICEQTRDAVVVDPSFYNEEEWERFHSYLDGIMVTTVKHVLLTHGHFDHVVGVPKVLDRWPHASLHMHPLEEDNYNGAIEMAPQYGFEMTTMLPEPSHELIDGDSISVGETIHLKFVHTPGHAPGHIAFVDDRPITTTNNNNNDDCDDDDYGAVIMGGDLLFRGSVGHTNLSNASSEDLLASLRRLNEEFSPNSIVLSGHTTPTKLRDEQETNAFVITAMQQSEKWYNDCKDRLRWIL